MPIIPNFTFTDLVKHPLSVFLITLMASTSVMYFALTNSYDARIKAAESRESGMKADRDTILKQYLIQLKHDAGLQDENKTLKTFIAKKDSITQTKIIQPLKNGIKNN